VRQLSPIEIVKNPELGISLRVCTSYIKPIYFMSTERSPSHH